MNIIVVDDEKIVMEDLAETVRSLRPDDEINTFTRADKALEYCLSHHVDVAFLDIQMAEMDGLTLAEKIMAAENDRENGRKTNIIFVTAYSEYATDAFDLFASGYLIKPTSTQSVSKSLENLRYPVEKERPVIEIRCFGKFEVFCDGFPVSFKNVRTKELFAYLVNANGTSCSNGEILGVLWEGQAVTDSVKSQLRNLVADMRGTFSELGFDDVIVKKRNRMAVNRSVVSCDYFDYMDGKEEGISKFMGEYMEQFSWAEDNVIKAPEIS